MFASKFFGLAALSCFAVLSTTVVAGCAADTADVADLDDETEVTEESAEALSRAGLALVGTYGEDPRALRSSGFRGLILSWQAASGSSNKFVADVDTGIRCVRAPCPSGGRIEGTFTATKKTITLRAKAADVALGGASFLGTYNYKVVGEKLTLKKAGFNQTVVKGDAYCHQASDCELQDIVHIMCVGHFTCSDDQKCGYSCGVDVDACNGKDRDECVADATCAPQFGPSACSADGRICTADIAYKGCTSKHD